MCLEATSARLGVRSIVISAGYGVAHATDGIWFYFPAWFGRCRFTRKRGSIMAIDLISLGKRLKKAREDRSVTQEAAAEVLGVPRTAIVQMEGGNRSISTLELSQLADLYERPIAEFFIEGPLPDSAEDEMLLALHRVTDTFKSNPGLQHEVS